MSSAVAIRFVPYTSKLLREWQNVHEDQVCGAWPMFPELAPMRSHTHPTFEAEARASPQHGLRSPRRRLSVLQQCLGRMMLLIPLMKMLRMFPVFPMFGRGQTVLQPSYVEDVGEAIARCFDAPDPGMTYELAGPNTYTYKELLQTMCNYLDIWRVLAPMPISVWKMLAFAAEFLPASPVTSNQVELMTKDNVASGGYPGFRALDIEPRGIEIVLAPARRVESA